MSVGHRVGLQTAAGTRYLFALKFLLERASFVVYLQLANLLTVLVCTLVPKLSVFVIALPEAQPVCSF